jgi:hypothetical protein
MIAAISLNFSTLLLLPLLSMVPVLLLPEPQMWHRKEDRSCCTVCIELEHCLPRYKPDAAVVTRSKIVGLSFAWDS